jgi:hypothetical protein
MIADKPFYKSGTWLHRLSETKKHFPNSEARNALRAFRLVSLLNLNISANYFSYKNVAEAINLKTRSPLFNETRKRKKFRGRRREIL